MEPLFVETAISLLLQSLTVAHYVINDLVYSKHPMVMHTTYWVN